MKKLFIVALLFLSLFCEGQIFTFTFSGSGTCPTQNNSVVSQPSYATVSDISRVGLNCQTYADWLNSSSWSTGASIDSNEYLEVSITASTGYKINAASLSFTLAKSATGPADIRIAHDGSVGIYNAQDNFTLTNTSNTNRNWDFSDFSSATAGTIRFRIYGWNAGGTSGTLRIDDLTLYGAITADSSGNAGTPFTFDMPSNFVGLGKTPSQKLDVEGNIRTSGKLLVGEVSDAKIATLSDYSLAVNGQALFTKARVLLQTNWPDYVFDDEYQLLPLNLLEKYINKNKHLPGIQPAAEAEKEGIDIATTQASLLKKIEELTLYIIQQNKKIDALSEQCIELQEKAVRIEKQLNRAPN